MAWDVTNNDYSIIISNTDGYSKTIYKSEVAVAVQAKDARLSVLSSQSPFQEIAWWTPEDITALTGASTIADGYTLLSGYLQSNS